MALVIRGLIPLLLVLYFYPYFEIRRLKKVFKVKFLDGGAR
jgi:hypothetical protein